MGLDISKFRKLLELDPQDPLSRFALGQALVREGTPESLHEGVEHLAEANKLDPKHLATYHILGQSLIALERYEEARDVLLRGGAQVSAVGEGMGRDLGPVMAQLLESIKGR